MTLPGGWSSFLPGMAATSSLTRSGSTLPTWNSSQMPQDVLVMVFIIWAIGLLNPGQLCCKTAPFRKELYSIALACLLWSSQRSGKKLLFHCDNQAVVDIWASGSSHDPLIMHLVRPIFFTAASNHFTVLVSHIACTDNSTADSLSRLQMSRFHQLTPEAAPEPTPTPKSEVSLWHNG